MRKGHLTLLSAIALLATVIVTCAASNQTTNTAALATKCVLNASTNLSTLNMGNAINNGTLDGKNLDLSTAGKSCLYHAELPNGITDIALINTSNGTLNFNEGGYSVTVSVHGTAIQHIAK